MRKIKLLIVLLLAYSGMKAQNTALQFDGVDDYVEVVSQPHRKNLRISTGFTIEFIMRINSFKGKHTLLYQDGRNGVFEIGLDAEMKLYTNFNHENFLSNEPLPVSECIHVSIIYHSSGADICMNGNPFTTITNTWSGEIFTLSEPFLLGLEQGNPSSAFDGFLENFRIINEVVDNGVIAQYTFKTLPISFPELALYLDGSFKATNKLRDPYYSHTIGYLGGINHNGANIPDLVEQHCVSEFDVPESVSSSCQPLPACSTVGLPVGELICNGSFEQYCSALNGTQPLWVLPEHAFQYTAQSAGGTSLAVPGSDVVNWEPHDNNNTPDFYVRNGIGSPIGFNPEWSIGGGNWIGLPPTNTHNGISNASAAIYSNGSASESLVTTLIQNLSPATTYQFSGWFYSTTDFANVPIPPSSIVPYPTTVELYIENSTQTQQILLGTLTIPYFSQVSGNNNWYYGTTTFTTPTPLTNFNRLVVKNNLLQQTVLFIDDLSLMEVPPTSFPQYIHTGNNTDSFHRTIKVDANDNVYVCGNSSNINGSINFGTPTITNTLSTSTDEYGSFIAKYSSGGTLLWSKWIPYVFVNDFEIMPNGNLLLVGYTIPIDLTAMLPAPFNYVTPTPSQWAICGNASRNFFHYESGDVFYGVIDNVTGNPIGNYELLGGLGHEMATNVEIIGNTAYIAVEIYNQDCTPTLFGQLDWGAFPIYTSQIVSINLINMTRSNLPGTAINSWLIELTKHNNDLILLSGDNLTTLNTTNNTTQSTPLPLQGGASFVNRVHAADNGDVYLIYNGMVEKRHVSNIGVVLDFQQVSKFPIGITSRSNDVFIAYSANGQIQIEKLEGAGAQNLLDADWSLNCSGNNMNLNTWQSLGDWKISDLAPLNNSAEIALVFNYQSTSTNWSLSLPPKNLFGTNGISHAHTIVAKVLDNTSSGQYNKHELSSDNASSLIVFPNPSEGIFTVQSTDDITSITVLNSYGQRVAYYPSINSQLINVDVTGFANGIYTLHIECTGNTKVEKLILSGK